MDPRLVAKFAPLHVPRLERGVRSAEEMLQRARERLADAAKQSPEDCARSELAHVWVDIERVWPLLPDYVDPALAAPSLALSSNHTWTLHYWYHEPECETITEADALVILLGDE